MGDARERLRAFPADVRLVLGRALQDLQLGYHPPIAKPLRGDLAGIAELRANDVAGTFRLVYTVRFEEAIYVLHAFQKKSPRGHEMARKDVRLIKDRLRHAQRHHESLRTSRDGSDR